MKKIVYIFMMLVIALNAQAQTASQARQILDKTAAVVGNKSGAQAKFSMSGKYGNATGTIHVKGKKFCAQTEKATVWYDGKTQWTLNKQAEEVSVSTPSEAQQQSMNPYTFINIYKNGFTMSSKTVSGKYQVHLTAQNKQRTIKEMYLTIDKTYKPTQVKMRTDKGWTVINISNFQAKNLSDSYFVFHSKDYPNAEVIDLR
ncbi:MAG: outer-membrane lipoprotein carrier protein LolA [Prevotella sp.]|nr:outer-membrane lipoprotein carrier protein LolA [Prevotella sp.]